MTYEIPLDTVKGITAIGLDYTWLIVPNLTKEAFIAYNRSHAARKNVTPTSWENANASAAIILTATAIEAYRNRVRHLERRKAQGRSVPRDFPDILARKNKMLPSDKLQCLLTEVFLTRNVIVHNYVYSVRYSFLSDGTSTISWQRLLKGYPPESYEKKYKAFTTQRTKRTNGHLRLNVQPTKVGFEDLFKVLIIFDVLLGLTQNILGFKHSSYFHANVDNSFVTSLSQFLALYYDKTHTIPNRRFTNEIERLAANLRVDFAQFTPSLEEENWFFTNQCPQRSCLGLGLMMTRGNSRRYFCNKCGFGDPEFS